MYKKIGVFFVLVLFFSACKTKQVATESAAAEEMAAVKVIEGHYKQKTDFETLNIRTSTKYSDEKQSYTLSADIRIEKDKVIWINVKKFGFSMARALITPTKVSYYEVLNSTYFDGNYDLISNWIGTDLDFNKVQNLFLGEAIDDLTKKAYLATIVEGMYKLTEKDKTATQKEFYFEATNFLVKKEWISQPAENRSVTISYGAFEPKENRFMPSNIVIEALQDDTIQVEIDYKEITFNERINTPFSIPEGFKEITIN